MKLSVGIQEDGYVLVAAEFRSGERPFGKYKWDIGFALFREEGELWFGIINKMHHVQWSIAADERAVQIIEAILNKGGWKAITKTPTEPEGSGYVSIIPSNFTETISLDAVSIEMLQKSLAMIKEA